MPNARSTALLSASLSVTAPAGSVEALRHDAPRARRRGSRRRRSAAKRASTAAARASRTGVVRNGTPASVRAFTRLGGLGVPAGPGHVHRLVGRRPRRRRWPRTRAPPRRPRPRPAGSRAGRGCGSASTTSSAPVNTRMSLKNAGGDVGRVLGRAERRHHLAQRAPASRRRTAAASGRRARPRRRRRCSSRPRSTARPPRCPCGRRPCANSLAMSTMGSTSSTSIRPDWRRAAR